MNLAKILELQNLNIAFDNVSKEYAELEISKKYLMVKDLRTKKKTELQDIANETNTLKDAVLGGEVQIKKILEDAKEIVSLDYDGLDADEIADEENALKKCEADLRAQIAALDGLKNSSQSAFRRLAQVAQEFQKISAERDALKVQYDEFGKEYKEKQDKIIEDIKKVKDSMADSDVALYDQIKESCGKSKAFVALSDQTCLGCGIDLEPSTFSAVREKGYGICPNCHRMVYFKDEN